MADSNAENIGAVSVSVQADYSGLQQDFDAAVALAVANGASLREAINSALQLPDTTPLEDAMKALGEASNAAATQFGTMGDAATSAGNAAGGAAPGVKELGDETQHAGEHAHEAESAFGEMAEKLVQFGEALAVTEMLKEFGEEALHAYDSMQKATNSLTALTGSAEAAHEVIEGIEKIAATQPFSFPELAGAAQKMAAFGIEAEKIPDLLTAAGNVSRATGNSFDGIASALERVEITGAVTGRQLVQLGLNWDDLAKAAGKSVEDTKAALAKGGQEASADLDVLLKAAQQKFGEFSKVPLSIGESWIVLQNQIHTVFSDIGEALAPVIQQIVGFFQHDLIPAIKSVTEWFKELPAPVKDAAVVLGLMAAAVPAIAVAVGGFGLAISGISAALPALTGLLGGLDAALVPLGFAFSEVLIPLGLLAAAVAAVHFSGLDAEAAEFAANLAGDFAGIGDLLSPLGDAIKSVGGVFADIWGTEFHLVSEGAKGILSDLGVSWDALKEATGSAATLSKKAFDGITDSLKLAHPELQKMEDGLGRVKQVLGDTTPKQEAFFAGVQAGAPQVADLAKALAALSNGLDFLGGRYQVMTDAMTKGNPVMIANATHMREMADAAVAAAEAAKKHAAELGGLGTVIEEVADKFKLFKFGDLSDDAAVFVARIGQIASAHAKMISDIAASGQTVHQFFANMLADAQFSMNGFESLVPPIVTQLDLVNGGIGKIGKALQEALIPAHAPLDQLHWDFQQIGLDAEGVNQKIAAQLTAYHNLDTDVGVSLQNVHEAWDKVSGTVNKLAKTDIPAATQALEDHVAQLIKAGATAGEVNEAEVAALKSEIALAHQRGEDASNQIIQLENLRQKIQDQLDTTDLLGKAWDGVVKTWNDGFASLGKTLADNIVAGNDWAKTWHSFMQGIEKEIMEELIGTAFKALRGEVDSLIGSLVGGLKGALGAVGGGISSLSDAALGTTSQLSNLSGALNPLSGIVNSTGSAVEGMGSAATSAGSTVASSASSFMSTFSGISAGVSAVTGVIGLFQNAAMHATEKLVEFNTRVSAIVESKELPLSNQIAVEQEGTLQDISTHTASLTDGLTQIINLLSIIGQGITGTTVAAQSVGQVSIGGGSINLGGDALGQLKYQTADLDTLKVNTMGIWQDSNLVVEGIRNLNLTMQSVGNASAAMDAKGAADFRALFGHPEKVETATAATATNTADTASATKEGTRQAATAQQEATTRGAAQQAVGERAATAAEENTRQQKESTQAASERGIQQQTAAQALIDHIIALKEQIAQAQALADAAIAEGNIGMAATFSATVKGLQDELTALEGTAQGTREEIKGNTRSAADSGKNVESAARGIQQQGIVTAEHLVGIRTNTRDAADGTKLIVDSGRGVQEQNKTIAEHLGGIKENTNRGADSGRSTADNTRGIQDQTTATATAARETRDQTHRVADSTGDLVTSNRALADAITKVTNNLDTAALLQNIWEATNHSRVTLEAIYTIDAANQVLFGGLLLGMGLLVANSWTLIRDADQTLAQLNKFTVPLDGIQEAANHIRVDTDALVDLARGQATTNTKMLVDLDGILLGSSLSTAALQSISGAIPGISTDIRAIVPALSTVIGTVDTAIAQSATAIGQSITSGLQSLGTLIQTAMSQVQKSVSDAAEVTKQTAHDTAKSITDAIGANDLTLAAQIAAAVSKIIPMTSSGIGGSFAGGVYAAPGANAGPGTPGYKSPYQQTGKADPTNFPENVTAGSQVQIDHDNAEAIAGYMLAYHDYVMNMSSHQYIPPDRRDPPVPPNEEVMGPPDIYGVSRPVPGNQPVTPQLPAVNYTGPDTPYDTGKMPSYDTGGYVPEDMIAQIHKGEYVMNTSMVNSMFNGASGSDALTEASAKLAAAVAVAAVAAAAQQAAAAAMAAAQREQADAAAAMIDAAQKQALAQQAMIVAQARVVATNDAQHAADIAVAAAAGKSADEQAAAAKQAQAAAKSTLEAAQLMQVAAQNLAAAGNGLTSAQVRQDAAIAAISSAAQQQQAATVASVAAQSQVAGAQKEQLRIAGGSQLALAQSMADWATASGQKGIADNQLALAQAMAAWKILAHVPSFDTGGYVAKDTLAMVHAGEYVIPPSGRIPSAPGGSMAMGSFAGGSSMAGATTVTFGDIHLHGVQDPQALARSLMNYLRTASPKFATMGN